MDLIYLMNFYWIDQFKELENEKLHKRPRFVGLNLDASTLCLVIMKICLLLIYEVEIKHVLMYFEII